MMCEKKTIFYFKKEDINYIVWLIFQPNIYQFNFVILLYLKILVGP